MVSAQRGQHLINLQILRAIAAGVVVIGHAGQEMTALAARTGQSAPSLEWFNWGWGVDIFFVISGFIMIHTSAGAFGEPGAARDFLRRRLIRIVPLYWLMTTALLLGALVAPRLLNVPIGDWSHVLASYLFIPDARPGGEIRPVVALGWTLNYEVFFYAFFALAMLLPLRKGLTFLFALFGLFILIGALGRTGHTQIDFWMNPLLAEFLFGVVIGLLHRRGLRLSRGQALGLAGAAVLAVVAVGPWNDWAAPIPEALRWGVPAALLVSAGALSVHAQPKVGSRALAMIGDASYALYLVHPFAIRPMREVWASVVGAKLSPLFYLPAALLVALGSAFVLHLAFEKPATRWLSQAGGSRRIAKAVTLSRAGA